MVSGPHGVPDSHMTASSYYEDSIYRDSPERARLNLEEERVQKENGNYVSMGGGWVANDKDKNEWIQVRFFKTSAIHRDRKPMSIRSINQTLIFPHLEFFNHTNP